jgi:biopolymer transport protein ExbD
VSRLTFTRRARTPSEAAGGVEIDVTPVMNMFIILIPFLVSMAVFTHVSIVEFGLPPNVGAGLDDSEGKPKLKTTVVVAADFLAITVGDKMLDSIPSTAEGHDLATFAERIVTRREQADIKDEVIVAVRDAVRFKHVIAVMDRCREAGFEKVGLSSATEEAAGKEQG